MTLIQAVKTMPSTSKDIMITVKQGEASGIVFCHTLDHLKSVINERYFKNYNILKMYDRHQDILFIVEKGEKK